MRSPDQIDELRKLDAGRVAVLLVDFQNDFCRPSTPEQDPAQTQANAEAARRASAFASEAAGLGMRVIYSQQILDPARLTSRQRRWEEGSQLCLDGSAGAELFVDPVPGSRIVRKYRFDIWQSKEFLATLEDWDIDGLIIGGVELICCVLYAALGADERGFRYAVPQDIVSGMRSSEQGANRAARDYLRSVHPSADQAGDLLHGWRPAGASFTG